MAPVNPDRVQMSARGAAFGLQRNCDGIIGYMIMWRVALRHCIRTYVRAYVPLSQRFMFAVSLIYACPSAMLMISLLDTRPKRFRASPSLLS